MMLRKIYISKFLLLFSISLLLSSCTVAYNSIRLTKKDGTILSKTERKIDRKKFRDNVVFVHVQDSVYQVEQLNFNVTTAEEKSISGNIVEKNKDYLNSYRVLKKHKRDRMNEMEIAGPNCAYFKQTHFFADRVIFTEGKVQVTENNVDKIIIYKRTRLLLFLLLGVGITILAGLGLLVLFFINNYQTP